MGAALTSYFSSKSIQTPSHVKPKIVFPRIGPDGYWRLFAIDQASDEKTESMISLCAKHSWDPNKLDDAVDLAHRPALSIDPSGVLGLADVNLRDCVVLVHGG